MDDPLLNALGVMYRVRPDDRRAFGERWCCGVDEFPHGQDVLVARYPKTHEDGQPVDVYVCALPARFYQLEVPASADSGGQSRPGYRIETGSGNHCQVMVAMIAEALAGGMLSVVPAWEMEE